MNPFKAITCLFGLFFTMQTARAYQPFVDNDHFFLKHLKLNRYELDTSASAIVLYDQGNYAMHQRADGSMYCHVKGRRVIKILTSKGVSHADIVIPFYSSESFEGKAMKVKAKTYNLVNGALKVSELDNKVATSEVAGNYYKLLKFSMPAVVPGSVIEYSYEIDQAPTLELVDWSFQDEIPVLHSEVSATYFDGFYITALKKATQPYVMYNEKDIASLPDTAVPLAYQTEPSVFSGTNTVRWVRRNLPAIVEEPYCYNIANYTDRLNVYIAGSIYSRDLNLAGWEGINKMIYKTYHSYLNDFSTKNAIKELLGSVFKDKKPTNALDSVKHIYAFVKDKFTIVEGNSVNPPDRKVTTFIEKKRGNGIEGNLLLSRIFKEIGYNSNIVLMTTREGIRISPEYPVIDQINYAVCRVECDKSIYYVDATLKYNPFGVLSPDCYNGFGWAVDETGFAVQLPSDAIRERSSFVLTTENSDKNNYIVSVMETAGDVTAPVLRKSWQKDSAEIKKYVLKKVKEIPFKGELLEYKVQNLHDVDEALKLSYRIRIEWPEYDKLFFTPAMYQYFSDNPFKAPRRFNPIEMPNALDVNYMLMLKLPEGYYLEEIPESKHVKLDDKNSYKYLAEYRKETNTVMVTTRLQMPVTFFTANNYHAIQNYFDKIIELQGSKGVISKAANNE